MDEYELHSKIMQYPQDIDFILKENVKILVDWINNGKGPFRKGMWTFGMIATSSCLKISEMGRIAHFPEKLQPFRLKFLC